MHASIWVAIASAASLSGESVVVWQTLVTSQSPDAGQTFTLAGVLVTFTGLGAHLVAVAGLASLSTEQVPESTSATVTATSFYVWLAVTLSGCWVAHHHVYTSQDVTFAQLASFSGVVGHWFAPVSVQALVTIESSGVVDTFQALSSGPVAVADGILIDVAVAHAPLAGSPASRLTEPTVHAELTLRTCSSWWAAGAHDLAIVKYCT